jgi:enoyl-CoA hydratase/carnithine racemase
MGIQIAVEGAVARVWLERPGKANALDSPLLAELLHALQDVSTTPGLKVLVLGGRGHTFCGGADIDELKRLTA